jgi:hypothetical protein
MTQISSSEIKEILESLGYKLTDKGNEWRSQALYRGGNNPSSLRIYKDSGVWKDFARDVSGNLIQLLKETPGGSSFIPQVVNGQTENSSESIEKKLTDFKYVKVFDPELLKKLKQDHSYWINRGVAKQTLMNFKGGLCYTGAMAGRYVFPIFDEGERILGFSGRSVFENNPVKWKHIGEKKNWCYPCFLSSDQVREENWLVVLESIGDMLKLWDNGVKNSIVSFGLSQFDQIYYKIIELDPSKIIISFNNDRLRGVEDHGTKAAIKFARGLCKYFNKDKIKIIPPKTKNDFGEMNEEEINEWKKTVKKYLT